MAGGQNGTPQYGEGSRIEGNYRDQGTWYPGKIVGGSASDGWDLLFDDGDRELSVPESRLRTLHPVGSQIEGNYRDRGTWYPGRVVGGSAIVGWDLLYDDGDRESAVPGDRIRALYPVGSRIEGNYLGQGTWYPGKIIAGSAAYGGWDLLYDDGDRESDVPEGRLRPEASSDGDAAAPAPASAGRLEKGDWVRLSASAPTDGALKSVIMLGVILASDDASLPLRVKSEESGDDSRYTPEQLERVARRPTTGARVVLNRASKDQGVLSKGGVGTIVRDDHDSVPYKVEVDGKTSFLCEWEAVPAELRGR